MAFVIWGDSRKIRFKEEISRISHGIAIPLLRKYPIEISAYSHQETCTRIFIAALFIII